MDKKTTKNAAGSEIPRKDAFPLSDDSTTASVAPSGVGGENISPLLSAPPTAALTPEQADRLPIFEQYLAVWGTEARGRELWQTWYEQMGEDGQAILDQLADASAEERGISPEDARRRMAVEKFLMDRGGEDYAADYLRQWRKRQLSAGRTLQPMAARKKKR